MKKKRNDVNNNIYEVIAQNIKYYRKKKGLTQIELAEKVDLSHEFIRRIESKKGVKYFSIDTVYRIAKTLEVEIQYFFEEIDDKEN